MDIKLSSYEMCSYYVSLSKEMPVLCAEDEPCIR
jgi:hypothetical protein